MEKEKETEVKHKKKKKYRGLRIFGKILLGLVLFVLLLLLFIRSPWGQDIIKTQLINYITNKTNTTIEVDRLFITFSGNIYIDGLYMEDKQGDTLIYSDKLEADVPLMPIINGTGFSIDYLDWEGVRANITRQDTIQGFNFSFLTEVFAKTDTTATTAAQDTTAAGIVFDIGEVHLTDFEVVYNDYYMGIESSYEVEDLDLEMEEVNLDSMKFVASSGSVKNAEIDYAQIQPLPNNPNADPVPLPVFAVDEFTIQNVNAEYKSVPDGVLADLDIDEFLVELPEANLAENIIEVEKLVLNNSEIFLKLKNKNPVIQKTQYAEASQAFEWPNWTIEASDIVLNNNEIIYLNNETEINNEVFNPNALHFKDFDLHADQIFLKDKIARANVQMFNFVETSGMELEKLQFEAEMDQEELAVQDLLLRLDENYIEGSFVINYKSIESFLQNPENAQIQAELPQFAVSLKDLFKFQPALRQNQYLKNLSKKSISGALTAEGTLSNLRVPHVNIDWGRSTSIVASGTVSNLTDPEQLRFNFPKVKINSTRGDLKQFLPEDQIGISIPDDVQLTANLSGSLDDVDAAFNLKTSNGNIAFDGNFSSGENISFNADIQTEDLDLGKLLNNQQFGNLDADIKATGAGKNINVLDATIDANIDSLEFRNYLIEDLNINGEIEDGEGLITANLKDDNINAQLETFVVLDSIAPKINTSLDIIGANLQDLGLSRRDIRVAFELDASFMGNLDAFNLNAEIIDGVAVHDKESYLLGDFLLSARVRPDSTALDIDNVILNLNLRSNTDPASFVSALNRHYQRYLDDDFVADTIVDPVNLQLRAEIRQQQILNEVFLTDLEEMDTVEIAVDFQEASRELRADIEFPYVQYSGIIVDSLALSLDSNRNMLDMNLEFQGLQAGPLDVQKTILSGNVEDNVFYVDLNSFNKGEKLMHLSSEFYRRNENVIFHLDPSEVILNSKIWEVPETNEILISDAAIAFQDFSFKRLNQIISAKSPTAGEKEQIDIAFENFNLAAFLSYLNPEEPLGSGNMTGLFTIDEPFGKTGMLADLKVQEFGVMGVPLGDMSLNAEAIGTQTYDFNMIIQDGNADLALDGRYYATENGMVWDTELLLDKIDMQVVEGFAEGAIVETGGSFSGNIDFSGTFTNPQYEGSLHFNDAAFTLAALEAPFIFPDETIQLNNANLLFSDFDILDNNGNELTLNGSINTSDYLNPQFDLAFEAKNFMLLNSEEGDNELYYGKAVVDATGELGGDLNVPRVEMDLNVDSETEITYVIPPSEIGIEERDGVVLFVNKENPDAILTETEEEAFTFTGFALNSMINIDEGSVLNIIIDEETGDNLRVVGEGELVFNVYTNGRTTLSGIYEMSDGHYEMSLYNLVNRRFDIVEGSTVTWTGDLLDANLDVKARYTVETSASSLMAPAISNEGTNVRARFMQEFPFYVYLNVDGELMEPMLTFSIDMPEEEQGAIGGEVYGRLQQLNQQEQELNKQVFSLLVLNRFYPEGNNDGSSGGTLAIARDNLNEALSDQLNLLGNKFLGNSGLELDFGLDTFTHYQGQTSEQRTQLDIAAKKTFLDQRLVVKVGSEVNLAGSTPEPDGTTPLIGNVSIEYLLTETGVFRLKGFRNSRYENVIDGQVIVSGVALIFTREFNKFRELWGNFILKNEEEEEVQ